MRRWFTAALTGAIAVSMLAACSATASGGDSTTSKSREVAIVTPYYVVPQVKSIVDLLQAKAKAAGWDVSVQDAGADFNKLNGDMQDAASRKVDAIVVVTGDPAQISVGLQAAKADDVPVFMMLSANELVPGLTSLVNADAAAGGTATAKRLLKDYKSGTILMIGNDQEAAIRARTAAAEKVFKAAGVPTTDVIQVLDPSTATQQGLDQTTNYINANPGKLGGVWSADDGMALGAAQAVERAGVKVPVTGITGGPEAIAAVAKGGAYTATYYYDSAEIVAKTVEQLQQMFAGTGGVGKKIFVSGQLVDASNVAKFKG